MEEIMIRFISGLVLAIAVIAGVVFIEGGRLSILVALSPFLLVLLFPFFCVMAVYRFKDIGRAFTDAFSNKKPSKRSEDVCRLFEKLFIGTGILGTLVGLVFVFSTLTDLTKIGGPLSVTLLSAVYGVVFYLLSLTWRMKLKEGK
jgi:flagellar motor component MotA